MKDVIAELRGLYEAGTKGPLTLIRYEHGGGRLYKEEPRTLVADFFDEPDRELFVAMHRHLPALLAVVEVAAEWVDVLNVAAKDPRIGLTMLQAGALCKLEDALSSLTPTERTSDEA